MTDAGAGAGTDDDGGPPPDDLAGDDTTGSGPSRRRRVIVGTGVVVALLVAGLVAVLAWPTDASGYTDEVEANFMAACTADGGDDVEPVCGCLYDEIVDTIPYDRFEEVNDALETERAADADASIQLPADFDEIRATCVDREGVTATTIPPTTGVDPETDATTTVAPQDTAPATTVPESPVVTSDAPNAAVPGGVRPTSPPRAPPPPPSPPGPGVPVQPPND